MVRGCLAIRLLKADVTALVERVPVAVRAKSGDQFRGRKHLRRRVADLPVNFDARMPEEFVEVAAGAQLRYKFLRAKRRCVAAGLGFDGGGRQSFGALNSLLIRLASPLAGTRAALASREGHAQRVRLQN